MKGERIRYQQTGEFHFLTFSCFRRRDYLSTVAAMELFEDALERVRLRYIHRNPVRRGLVAKPEDWRWSSYRHDQTGMHGTVEIEPEWTARERGWQLPEWMRYRQFDSPSPVPNCEGPGAPST